MIENPYAGMLIFDIHPRIAYNLADHDFSRVLTLHQKCKRKHLMNEGHKTYSITYRIAYALSNRHHFDLFLRKEYIEIPRIFKNSLRHARNSGPEIIGTGVAARDNGRQRQKSVIITTNCDSEIHVLRREKAFNRIMPLNFRSKRGNRGLIDTDSFYEESENEIKNLKEALQEIKSLYVSEESRLSLENVKRLIQRNFSENPLAWRDMNKIEATLKVKEECKYEYVRYKPIMMNMEDKKDMQSIIKVHINLGPTEPGISAYSSPGFLIRNNDFLTRDGGSIMLRLKHLRENLEEHNKKFGRLAASSSEITYELKEQGSKPAFTVHDSRPITSNSSTDCTRPSPDSDETTTIRSQEMQTPDDSSQPSTSGVKEGEISLRPMIDTSRANTNELISSSYIWKVYQKLWKKINFSQRRQSK
ncbi:hypothetical protein Sango_2872900 [Sesamum angolense]|uniref:Uncharacterized protein n=1 Tax=Sesamum angolense TaxID=2727404 RepID=A0AAE1T5S2_9LAMI|nr:hypothetical protein Sango_2872900 [Sesamum angolense]